MDSLRHQLLSGAGSTADQDRIGRRRIGTGRTDQFSHNAAAEREFFEPATLPIFF